jgi:hypothetical protein
MSKSLAAALLSIPLIVAGHVFGKVCEQFGQAYALLLSPSTDLLALIAKLLLALAAVTTTAGLVAVLVRPLWLGISVFAVSALALLLAWQLSPASILLVLIYALAGAAYVVAVDRELLQRVSFSLHVAVDAQGALRLALILVACGSLYLTCAPRIQEEGFAIPDEYLDPLASQMEKQVLASVPESQRTAAAREFRQQFQSMMDGLVERMLGRYERFLPALVVAGVFTSLVTIVSFLAWVPGLILKLVFALLATLGLTKVVTETREVRRLTLA